MKHTEAIGGYCHRIYFCTQQIQKQVDAFYIEAKERLRDVPMHLLDPKKELFKRWLEREVNRFLIGVLDRFGDLKEYTYNQLMSEPTKGELEMDFDEVSESLKSKLPKDLSCPYCPTLKDFSFHGFASTPIIYLGQHTNDAEATIPSISCICSGCGYTQNFNAFVVDPLLKNES